MTRTKLEVEQFVAARPGKPAVYAPILVAPANEADVMREQLEYLIEHTCAGVCDCSICQRYAGVRGVLLAPFLRSGVHSVASLSLARRA